MYHKLARGYATAYLQSLTDHDRLENWFHSRSCNCVLNTFEESARSKKPGRVLRRLTPLLRPTFGRAMVGRWRKDFKMILVEAMSAAREVDVMDITDADKPLYQERGAFLSNLVLTEEGDNCTATLITEANISHHALTRLLEREFATPQTLRGKVREILAIARNMALTLHLTNLDPGKTYAFMIPCGDGALPAVTMNVRAGQGDRARDKPHLVISVRTFLDGSMLTRDDRERMGGLIEVMAATADEDRLQRHMVRWMEVNARPWSRKADARVEDDRSTQAGL